MNPYFNGRSSGKSFYAGMGQFTGPVQSQSAYVLALFTVLLVGCVRTAVSVAQVDKMIRDQVPIGSDRKQVKAFIDDLNFGSLRIGRSDFHEATPDTLGNRDPEKVAELRDKIKEFTGAVVFDAENGFLYQNNLIIQFYLDEAGRMIGYTVKMDGAE